MAEPAVEMAPARFRLINGQRLAETVAPSALAKKHLRRKQR